MISVETFYLTALLSAFIGLIALFALPQPPAHLARTGGFLGRLIVITAVISVASFFFYALSPRIAARQVYGQAYGPVDSGFLRIQQS
ncbi:hypothetical protein WOC76_03500 [Methylocystis sp. IM3]|uniref:hypothetical protein n=1 Tax=unclassified Methylocystis TaxID=2625913 RepID=UPI0030F83594